MRRSDRLAWLALLLTIPAAAALAAPGYFFGAHDAPHSVFFLVEFDQAIKSGAVWPMWAADQAIGFGYPLWLVYAPLAYWVAEILHLAGLGMLTAVKATWAISFFFGALGAYRLGRHWWGPAAGLITSLLYTYAPYHLVQIYVRAALAEFAAVAWFPWALLALALLLERPGPRRAAAAALALGALLLTHTVSQLIFVPALAGFVVLKLAPPLWNAWQRRRAGEEITAEAQVPERLGPRVGWSATALILGGLLAMIFILPAFLERSYIQQAQFVRQNYSYSRQFVYPSQFLSPFWGFGYAVEGAKDDMSLQLGLLPFLGAVLGTAAATAGVRSCRLPHRAEALYVLALSVGAVFAMLPLAEPLWNALPLVGLIQFPWRLLTLTTVTLAVLGGAGVRWLSQTGDPSPDERGRDRRPVDPLRVTAGRAKEEAGSPRGVGPYVYWLAVVIVLASFAYTAPVLQPPPPDTATPLSVIDFELRFPDMRGMTRWSERMPLNEDSPLLEQYKAGVPLQRAAIASGSGEIVEQSANAISADARVRADGRIRLRFYTYYFPGWRATIDGQAVEISPDPPNGLIGLDVPPGDHQVHLQLGMTPIRSAGAVLSILALAVVIVLHLHNPRS